MNPTPRFPNELINETLAYLTPTDPIRERALRETLKACCLAGRPLRDAARPLLFKHVILGDSGLADGATPTVFNNVSAFLMGYLDLEEPIVETTGAHSVNSVHDGQLENAGQDSEAGTIEASVLDDASETQIPVLEEGRKAKTVQEISDGGDSSLEQSGPQILGTSPTCNADETIRELFTVTRFASLLSDTPDLGTFVHSLTLWLDPGLIYNEHLIEETAPFGPVMKALTQLRHFGFVRCNPHAIPDPYPIQSRSEDVLWRLLSPAFQDSIMHVARLPTVETLDFTYGIMFPDPATLCDIFRDCSPNLRALKFSCLAFENPDMSFPMDQIVPANKPMIDSLELNFIESDIHGPRLVKTFLEGHSPFDISALKHLRIHGIDYGDRWIETILSNQQADLKHLKKLQLYGIHSYADSEPPFKSVQHMEGLVEFKVSTNKQWKEWVKQLPIRNVVLDEDTSHSRPRLYFYRHQIFELGPV